MKFLGRAKKFLQDLGPEPAARVQYFNVACASGHRVRGERTEGYQALRCPACGEGVFVLPRSPLPEPVAPPGTARSRGTSRLSRGAWVDEGPVELTDPARGAVELEDGGSGRGEAEIVWDDDPDGASRPNGAPVAPRFAPEDLAAAEIEAARRNGSDAADREGGRPTGPTAGAGTTRPGRTKPSGKPAISDVRPRREAAEAPGAARPTRPRRTTAASLATTPEVIEVRSRPRRGPRVGLIFVFLTVLIVAAVGWRAWMYRRQQLPRVVERGRVEGLPALDSGDFDRAYQLLSAAKAAVDTLGGIGKDADEIRQAADEAEIFVDLCPKSLEDMLAEAGRTDPDAWESRFDTFYKGHFCVFDTLIESTPQEGGTGSYQLAYVVFPPGEASRFGDGGLARPDKYALIDLAGFELFDLTPPPRDGNVTFGARLRSMVYDSEKKHWVVGLDPKSGVFITHHRPLQTIGWPAPELVEVPREDMP